MTQTMYLNKELFKKLEIEKELKGKTGSQIIKEALELYFSQKVG